MNSLVKEKDSAIFTNNTATRDGHTATRDGHSTTSRDGHTATRDGQNTTARDGLGYAFLSDVLERLAQRFRFDTEFHSYGANLKIEEMKLNILEDGQDFSIIFEPINDDEPLHLQTKRFELEAVLREILAG